MMQRAKTLISGVINPPQLHTILQNSSWSLKTLFEGREVHIEPQTVTKLCRLSGLNDALTEESRDVITRSLQQQIKFIEHLYDDKQISDTRTTPNDNKLARSFRLIQSDHQPTKSLTLADLEAQIKLLQPSAEKGETGSWPVVPEGKGLTSRSGGDVFTIIKK